MIAEELINQMIPALKFTDKAEKAIIWMDSRGSEQIKKINGGLIEVEGYAIQKVFRWMHLTTNHFLPF